eukprot:16452085-Heterocapsa_arctica.AAC.1
MVSSLPASVSAWALAWRRRAGLGQRLRVHAVPSCASFSGSRLVVLRQHGRAARPPGRLLRECRCSPPHGPLLAHHGRFARCAV